MTTSSILYRFLNKTFKVFDSIIEEGNWYVYLEKNGDTVRLTEFSTKKGFIVIDNLSIIENEKTILLKKPGETRPYTMRFVLNEDKCSELWVGGYGGAMNFKIAEL